VKVTITVNGQARSADIEPRTLLVQFLRDNLGLTGTHTGCETSQCGACTVLLGGDSVKSCTILAVQADGAEVTTIEGIAPDGALDPIQQAFWEEHGLQCGYCTPGFLMTAMAMAAEGHRLTRDEVREELAGVICRCTGYRNVVTAVERYVAEAAAGSLEVEPVDG
jgi:carbon-monoxide dehydrogenase small subunit